MEEKKPMIEYVIRRSANGDIDVADTGAAETTLSTEEIYKDIEEVARTIQLKRIENAAYLGVYRFYGNVSKAQHEGASPEGTQAAAD